MHIFWMNIVGYFKICEVDMTDFKLHLEKSRQHPGNFWNVDFDIQLKRTYFQFYYVKIK